MSNRAKSALTGKCKCASPNWAVIEVRGNVQGVTTMRVRCHSCDALWETKSRNCLDDLMDSVVFENRRTLKEILAVWDEKRKRWLKGSIENANQRIAEIEKDRDKYVKELKEIENRL